uniref:Uncharacterized protein n=1 Tax=Arundo donax TaxID=35708 RepID=A0A0A9HGZ3_ARUDO
MNVVNNLIAVVSLCIQSQRLNNNTELETSRIYAIKVT